MTLSVTIYFRAHCGHTGSPDWGDVPQGRLWVESHPRRLRPCGPVLSCGPVPFAVTACSWAAFLVAMLGGVRVRGVAPLLRFMGNG